MESTASAQDNADCKGFSFIGKGLLFGVADCAGVKKINIEMMKDLIRGKQFLFRFWF